VYEISNYIVGVEQLTTTTLRNVVGGMSLEDTLTSRDEINGQLRGVLDEATGRWGIRVARVELKAIDPPPSIQESMERQMKADREKRAMILTAEGQRESAIKSAEGQKQSQILTAEGAKQAAILSAEAERQSRILRAQGDRAARYLQAQGQAKAIEKVFAAIKAGKPTPELLAYQYLQTLPQMAQGEANKVWLVPSDFGKALEGFTRMLGAPGEDGVFRFEPSKDDGDSHVRPEDDDEALEKWFDVRTDPEIAKAVAAAEAVARQDVPPLSAVSSAAASPPAPPPPPPATPGPGPRSVPPGANRAGGDPSAGADGGLATPPGGFGPPHTQPPRTEPPRTEPPRAGPPTPTGPASQAPENGSDMTPPGGTPIPPGYPQPPSPS
jgi:regulator of protease activity HflC (stomatin/prohibitin superfamily)